MKTSNKILIAAGILSVVFILLALIFAAAL